MCGGSIETSLFIEDCKALVDVKCMHASCSGTVIAESVLQSRDKIEGTVCKQ